MATIGFEEKLWEVADKLRNNMDAAEYKLRNELLSKLMSDEISVMDF